MLFSWRQKQFPSSRALEWSPGAASLGIWNQGHKQGQTQAGQGLKPLHLGQGGPVRPTLLFCEVQNRGAD